MSPEEALAAALYSASEEPALDEYPAMSVDYAIALSLITSRALTAEGYAIVRSDELARLRAALEAVIRLIEPIPLSFDVEQAGMQSEVAIATARAALEDRP